MGSGVSTLILARSLQLNGAGHAYSLEHLAEYAMRTPDEHGMGAFANVLEAPLRTHRIGSSESWWYAVGALPGGAIDMLVVDGPPWTTGPLARYPAGPLLFRRLAPGAVVIVDDAARADEGAVLERWREYPDLSQEKVECEKGCTLLRRASGKPRPTP